MDYANLHRRNKSVMSNERKFRWDVFLSHSSRDKDKVRRLAEKLRTAGLEVWFDAWVILPGDSIPKAIEDGLQGSRILVLCMSPSAFGSDWVMLERHTSLFKDPQNRERRFIPLLLEDCTIPDTLAVFSYTDWRKEDDEALSQLLKTCSMPKTSRRKRQNKSQPNQKIVSPVKGVIPLDEPRYIKRKADEDILSAARQGKATTITIKGPWQTGKSSLLVRYLASLEQAQTVLVDLSEFTEPQMMDHQVFLELLASFFWKGLGRPAPVDKLCQPQQYEFTEYVENLLAISDGKIVFAFDNADKVLGKDYQKDFFSMLRSWHDKRAFPKYFSTWAKLSLALVISTEPYLLIETAQRSPFNVSSVVELSSFRELEFYELKQFYDLRLKRAELNLLMDLLHGHPQLVQLAFYDLSCSPPSNFPDWLKHATDRFGLFGEHLRGLEAKLNNDGSRHLLPIFRRLITDGTIPERDDFYRLHGAGLVREEGMRVVPSCKLYARFFERQ